MHFAIGSENPCVRSRPGPSSFNRLFHVFHRIRIEKTNASMCRIHLGYSVSPLTFIGSRRSHKNLALSTICNLPGPGTKLTELRTVMRPKNVCLVGRTGDNRIYEKNSFQSDAPFRVMGFPRVGSLHWPQEGGQRLFSQHFHPIQQKRWILALIRLGSSRDPHFALALSYSTIDLD